MSFEFIKMDSQLLENGLKTRTPSFFFTISF
jgi:hypothetical protein